MYYTVKLKYTLAHKPNGLPVNLKACPTAILFVIKPDMSWWAHPKAPITKMGTSATESGISMPAELTWMPHGTSVGRGNSQILVVHTSMLVSGESPGQGSPSGSSAHGPPHLAGNCPD